MKNRVRPAGVNMPTLGRADGDLGRANEVIDKLRGDDILLTMGEWRDGRFAS
jgi:hypothetical protein